MPREVDDVILNRQAWYAAKVLTCIMFLHWGFDYFIMDQLRGYGTFREPLTVIFENHSNKVLTPKRKATLRSNQADINPGGSLLCKKALTGIRLRISLIRGVIVP